MARIIYHGQKTHIAFSQTSDADVKKDVVGDVSQITDFGWVFNTTPLLDQKTYDFSRLANIQEIAITGTKKRINFPFSFKTLTHLRLEGGTQQKIDLRYTILNNTTLIIVSEPKFNQFIQPLLPWSVKVLLIENSQLYDTLDLSRLTVNDTLAITDNVFLEGINFNTGTTYYNVRKFIVCNNPQLRFVEFSIMAGILSKANSIIDIQNIGAGFHELKSMLEAINNQVSSGQSGRSINISKNHEIGEEIKTIISEIESKGINVIV